MKTTLTLSAVTLLMGSAAFAGMSVPLTIERPPNMVTSLSGDMDRAASDLIFAMSDADGASGDESEDDEGDGGEEDEEDGEDEDDDS
ncbi:hypothetical protein [Aestuariivita sp.]|uniref:hypothetical protein n=1 Tax=Aestuariivita sp. TaxID=1872407 RepID=UPI00217045E2|nr:hypothetical protein [Aestuariivita sp.]MCE8006361.1 hypothetical protein [Aestuariivita sp.]